MGVIVFELFLTSMVFEAVRSLKTQISVHPTVCATSSILELYIMTRKTGLSTIFSFTKTGKKSSEIIPTHCDLAGARFYPFFRALYLLY